jgi:DNA-binding GntR family transcriptional regulator
MALERERVYEEVRGEIISCALRPGLEIREAALAERYGVSKSPVRDAMQKLALEGLIEVEPRRGYRVAQVRVEDAEHILDLRVILETAAVRRAAVNATDEELAELDRFRSPDVDTVEGFAAYNERFHQTVSALSGNARLAAEIGRAMEYYQRLVSVSLTTLQGNGGFEEPLADHIAIIDALQARKGAAAARRVAQHIGRSRKHVMRGLMSRPIVG